MVARLRTVVAVLLVLGLVASVADARGGGAGGGRMGGGAKRGKKGAKSNAQVEQIIHDTYRCDVVNRSRYVGW